LAHRMRICYVLLSPSPGMHEYTSDLARVMANTGHDVGLVTTACAPLEAYGRDIAVHAPVATSHAGLSLEALRTLEIGNVLAAIDDLAPDVVHLTGPHPWNLALLRALRRQGIPVVHSLHNLDSRRGMPYDLALSLWNRGVLRVADHILVHGPAYRQRLLAMGLPVDRVTWTPLLYLFLGKMRLEADAGPLGPVTYEPWALYLGSLQERKELNHLITACAMMDGDAAASGAAGGAPRLLLAGQGDVSRVWAGPLPEGVEVHAGPLDDREASDLLARCGLLVVPRADWSQPARVAAAYYYYKPVVVTRSVALPECVEEGVTGYVVEPGHPATLARRLDRLLGTPERLARMGTAGRAWYDDRREREEGILLAMYTRLADGRSVQRGTRAWKRG
jgi:glycosyltransferase involved in cell wall biosynthesis